MSSDVERLSVEKGREGFGQVWCYFNVGLGSHGIRLLRDKYSRWGYNNVVQKISLATRRDNCSSIMSTLPSGMMLDKVC
jgi:hypothetical protein